MTGFTERKATMNRNKKQVMIKMRSVQSIDEEDNELELITEGTFEEADGKYLITYKDSEATGYEDSVTTVEVQNDNLAVITRTGKSNSSLVIESGKKHHCHYGTPYGDMMVGIYTHKIQNDLHNEGGYLYLRYTIDINSSYISDNEIIMDIDMIS